MKINPGAASGGTSSPGPYLLLAVVITMLAALVWPRGERQDDAGPAPREQRALEAPAHQDALCTQRLTTTGGEYALFMPYCSGIDLDAAGAIEGVDRLLVYLPERADLAPATYAALRASLPPTTAVFVPQWLQAADLPAPDEASLAYWGSDPWAGGLSLRDEAHPRPTRISSFAFIDKALKQIVDAGRLPSLREVLVAGHGSGANAALRYGAAGVSQPPEPVALRVLAMGPTSYVYFSSERPAPGDSATSYVPEGLLYSMCKRYDSWPYGIQDLYSYVKQSGPRLAERTLSRPLTVLVPEGDDPTAQPRCGARYQGGSLSERALAWAAHVEAFEVERDGGRRLYAATPSAEGLAGWLSLPCAAALLQGELAPSTCSALVP